MSIEAKDITKKFGQFTALDHVDLKIPSGELVALLGPSGSGKTTLLRIIAGLEFADSGTILFDGEDTTHRTARDRRVGFVFQHYALFRHMTVFENIAFGLKVRPRNVRPSKEQIQAKVHELLGLIQLKNLAGRYPSQLSGGQRQRVALARALAVEPSVLLLDEPFGSLDAKVRLELRRWLRQLHDEVHITSVFVTHDQEEALEVSDRVAVMNEGRIEQVGSPDDVYHHPITPFVYNFLGNVNLFHGRIDEETPAIHDAATGDLVYVRPHLLEIQRQPNGGSNFRATIKHINSAGPLVKIEAVSEWGAPVQVEMSQERFRRTSARQRRNRLHHPQRAEGVSKEGHLTGAKPVSIVVCGGLQGATLAPSLYPNDRGASSSPAGLQSQDRVARHLSLPLYSFAAAPRYRHYERAACAPRRTAEIASNCLRLNAMSQDPYKVYRTIARVGGVVLLLLGVLVLLGWLWNIGLLTTFLSGPHHDEAEHRRRLPVSRPCSLPADAVSKDSQHPTLVRRLPRR